jgi:tRNA A-37 threonylcarbamoyl transferase component Bud32
MSDRPSETVMTLGGALAGKLPERGLLDLLRLLHRSQATGVVHVAGVLPVQVHLRAGSIRAAFFGDQVGPSALTRAIIAGVGDFRLADLPPGVPRNIPHDTVFLLDSVGKVLAEIERERGVVHEDPFAAADAEAPAGPDERTQRFATFAPPQRGARFGKCVLGDEIGRGASSIVYRAHHEALDIPVVVKVLMPEDARSPARMMTVNEARLLARLHHPHILRVFDFDDSADHPHLIVELIEGPGLQDVLRDRGRVPMSEALPWFRQVTEALSYAWDTLRLVHCDLKPDNILLAGGTVAKLADLGLAKVGGASSVFGDDVVGGTPSYIAPEQVESGHAAVDHRSDIYALGATFYHVLMGHPPFVDEDPIQLMCKRLREDPIAPHVLDPTFDRRLSDLLMGMLARHPDQRIGDYDQILDTLEALAETEASADDGIIRRRRSSFWRNASRLFGRDAAHG